MIPVATRRRSSGFTLVELLTATVITVILFGVLSAVCSQALHQWHNGSNRLNANSDIRIAMDIIAADLKGALLREGGYETLHAQPMSAMGDSGYQASNATCLMFFTSTLDRKLTDIGNVNAVCYQLAYQDDIQTGGSNPVLALYRTSVDAPTTYSSVLGLSNLYDGYWKGQQAAGKTTDLSNFLIPNVIDFKLTFWYKDSTGTLNRIDPSVSEIRQSQTLQITPAPTGFDGNSKLAFVDVSITVLTREGGILMKAKALPMSTLSRKFAYTYVRRIQLNAF